MMFTGSLDHSIKLWNIRSGECIKTIIDNDSPVYCIRQMSSNKLISGTYEGSIKIWDTVTNQFIKINEHTAKVTCIQIISNERFATCSIDKTIKLFKLKNDICICIRTFSGHLKQINQIAKFFNDEKIISSDDKTIRLWDLNSEYCLKVIDDHLDEISCIEIISDEIIISGSYNGLIKVWNIVNGQCMKTLSNHNICCILKLSNNEIACNSGKSIKIWNISNGDCLKTINVHRQGVTQLERLSKDTIISSSFDKTIKISNITNGACLKSFKGHEDTVFCFDLID
jgi:WD40 repeat protein